MERLADFTQKQLIDAQALDFCRWVQCLHECDGASYSASRMFLEKFPNSLHISSVQQSLDRPGEDWRITKAAVSAGLTNTPAWAGALIGSPELLSQGFIAYVDQRSVLGKIPNLLKAPFKTP